MKKGFRKEAFFVGMVVDATAETSRDVGANVGVCVGTFIERTRHGR
jgi:hypothetical protein